ALLAVIGVELAQKLRHLRFKQRRMMLGPRPGLEGAFQIGARVMLCVASRDGEAEHRADGLTQPLRDVERTPGFDAANGVKDVGRLDLDERHGTELGEDVPLYPGEHTLGMGWHPPFLLAV